MNKQNNNTNDVIFILLASLTYILYKHFIENHNNLEHKGVDLNNCSYTKQQNNTTATLNPVPNALLKND